jgi:hypothetical protein
MVTRLGRQGQRVAGAELPEETPPMCGGPLYESCMASGSQIMS